jgi:hypothetical protein
MMKIAFPAALRLALSLLVAVAVLAVSTQQVTAQESDDAAKYKAAIKDATSHSGLIKMHQKGQKLFFELTSGNLDKDYIIVISIARGIAQGQVLGGMSWGFGDDWLWQFRKVDDDIFIVRRNVRFTAKSGSPEEKAVKLAYTDSVLFSLPIVAKSPSGGMLIDVSPVFMADLPQISNALPGFSFSSQRSTWASVKALPENVELEVAATYGSGGGREIDTVPDSRGATINVHYSISTLPSTGYQPRLADDRIGYFLTVIKDFSKPGDQERFVRYINRWDLQKADSSAELSPPKKPIIFWLEKTVPFKYRKAIRDGILEWNKAYEKVGFANAIEVRQQPDNADWDPEDIRYNTFRWITSNAGFAMGPSRVNPTNGQILDADIIFDADFVDFWKEQYETFTAQNVAALTGGPLDLESYREWKRLNPHHLIHGRNCRCELHQNFSRELAFGATWLMAQSQPNANTAGATMDRLIEEGLKEVVMHEVGHTLGLRHNFKASSLLTLKELHNTDKTGSVGITASVMDYAPINLAPKGVKQGHFYSQTIGPYDMWAIEYGYKPLSGSTDGDLKELQKIGARSGEPGHAFATDNDTRGVDSDPLTNRFDLSDDPIGYARQQAEIVASLWPDLVKKTVKDGEGYQQARRAFGILLAQHGRASHFASRFIGGLYVNRHHKGDPNGKPPFEVVEVEKQREAMKLLEDYVFSDKPFSFPPELYNHLASSRWDHWGTLDRERLDYAVHEVIAMWQDRILEQLLSSLTLQRLHDSELKVPVDKDAFTTAELLERLTKAVFAELDSLKPGEFTNRKPAVSSLRRNLQRTYLKRLSNLSLGNTSAPQDCQTVAYAQLQDLKERMTKVKDRGDLKLDAYTKAHFIESASRIEKVLDARISVARP